MYSAAGSSACGTVEQVEKVEITTVEPRPGLRASADAWLGQVWQPFVRAFAARLAFG